MDSCQGVEGIAIPIMLAVKIVSVRRPQYAMVADRYANVFCRLRVVVAQAANPNLYRDTIDV